MSSMSGSSRDLATAEKGAPKGAELGQARLMFDDFGTLDTHALESVAAPWKLYSTALLLSTAPELGLPIEHASIRPALEHFGFFFPDSIGNWDSTAGPPPRFTDAALGQTRAMIHGFIPGPGLEVRNNGCVTCHSAPVYDAAGLPTRTAWIGLPSVSIDLEAYSAAVFKGLKLGMQDEKKFFSEMERVHPNMSWGERYAYRHFVFPRLRRDLPKIVAARGRQVFAGRCARCHGSYEEVAGRPHLIEYPNRLVTQSYIGTDSTRWRSVDDKVLAWQQANPTHPFAKHVDAARTGGYVAPILDGIWATAPYLHNGSVPTLWHLLHPDQRPAKFEVGGHRLDYTRMGIALESGADGVWRYPAGYVARSRSAIYDTSELGKSNRGHEAPLRDLSEDEKSAVLEFLKTL